jgi:Tfp pilus assembly protein PilZ
MTDFIAAARSARAQLSQGLAALQEPDVPEQLLDAAQPIAQAMGALHRIEASGGAELARDAQAALLSTRQALSMLQTESTHPAVDQALEAIAGSLGLVHELNELASAALRPPPLPQPQQQPPASAIPPTQPSGGYARPEPQHEPPRQYTEQPAGAREPPAREVHPPGEALRVEAELGAHSQSNFYKGLSGNDVIESGGIFIATYRIPVVGRDVLIKVTLPGGYEFEAMGVVKWTRDAPRSGAPDAPPGFGAKFTQISPDGRQLVQRYVRNREPLFHDDP